MTTALALLLVLPALADRGASPDARGDDPGTAPNPDAESHDIVDHTPVWWTPMTGDVLVEGRHEVACIQEDLLAGGTQGRRFADAELVPRDPDTWLPLGPAISPVICMVFEDGRQVCDMWLEPGLYTYTCTTVPYPGELDVDPTNDVVHEVIWVQPAG